METIVGRRYTKRAVPVQSTASKATLADINQGGVRMNHSRCQFATACAAYAGPY